VVPPPGAIREARRQSARLEDFTWLREQGEDIVTAGKRVGVARRTAWKLEAARKRSAA